MFRMHFKLQQSLASRREWAKIRLASQWLSRAFHSGLRVLRSRTSSFSLLHITLLLSTLHGRNKTVAIIFYVSSFLISASSPPLSFFLLLTSSPQLSLSVPLTLNVQLLVGSESRLSNITPWRLLLRLFSLSGSACDFNIISASLVHISEKKSLEI